MEQGNLDFSKSCKRKGMAPRLRIVINILILILAFSLASGKALAEEVELKHDDGTNEDGMALGGWQYVISFSPPTKPWEIEKVRIYGVRYGTAPQELNFRVTILDKSFNVLSQVTQSHSKFPYDIYIWVDVNISAEVKDDFYVLINTDSLREYGIRLGIDKSIKNAYSEVARGGKLITWDLNIPKDTTNWMIRVVGSTPSIEIPVTPEAELIISSMEDISLWDVWKGDENDIVTIEKDGKYSKNGSSLKAEYKFDGKGDNWGGVQQRIDVSIPEIHNTLEFWSYVLEPEESGQFRVKLSEPDGVRYIYTFRTPTDKGCIQHSISLSQFNWEKTSNEDPNKKLDIGRVWGIEFATDSKNAILYLDDIKFVIGNESAPKEVKTPVECRFPLPAVPLKPPTPAKGVSGPRAIEVIALLLLIGYSLRIKKMS